MDFRLLIDLEVLQFADRLSSDQRAELRAAFVAILNDPHSQSDANDVDEIGRGLKIKIVGEYALTYWIDYADQHIKILDIHSADR